MFEFILLWLQISLIIISIAAISVYYRNEYLKKQLIKEKKRGAELIKQIKAQSNQGKDFLYCPICEVRAWNGKKCNFCNIMEGAENENGNI